MNHCYRRSVFLILFTLFCGYTLSACDATKDGPFERAGEKVDKTVDKAKDKADKAADKIGEKVEEVGEEIQDRD